MKKKYGLFKVLMTLLLLIVIASYFINGRDGKISFIAFGDVFVNYMQSFYYFFETALFIFVVGGFYGLLNRVPAYKKLIRKIADKVSNKSKLFVVIITIVFALISSLAGLNTILLLIIPFVISIVLLLGYDKLVALSATVGGTLVGYMGGIFVTLKDPASQYETSYVTFEKLAGVDGNWTLVLPEILLLLVATGLLVFYIINHIKKVDNGDVSYELTKGDALFVEPRDKFGKKIRVNDKGVKVWPLAVGFGVLLVLLILGYMPWNDLFGVKVFSDFHTWLTSFTFNNGKYIILLLFIALFIYLVVKLAKMVKNDGVSLKACGLVILLSLLLWIISIFGVYALEIASKSTYAKWIAKLPIWTASIYNTLLSGNFVALGNFSNMGTYMVSIILMVVLGVIMCIIYKVDFDDAMDGFIYGVKKFTSAAMIMMLGYAVLVCSYNNGFIETIITNVNKSFGNNVVAYSFVSMLGSILNVDIFYTSAGVFSNIVSNLEKVNFKVYALMFQSLFGFVQLFAPTSIMLIVGLSYLEVSYKTWMKYIWRLLLGLLMIIFFVLMIVSLL